MVSGSYRGRTSHLTRCLFTMAVRRLHRSREIREVFATRNAAHGRALSVHARAGDGEDTRVAVVVGRDIGNAVRRNRAKRRLRAAVQQGTLPAGFDLVVRAKPATVEADFDAVRSELERLTGLLAGRERR